MTNKFENMTGSNFLRRVSRNISSGSLVSSLSGGTRVSARRVHFKTRRVLGQDDEHSARSSIVKSCMRNITERSRQFYLPTPPPPNHHQTHSHVNGFGYRVRQEICMENLNMHRVSSKSLSFGAWHTIKCLSVLMRVFNLRRRQPANQLLSL